MLQDIRYAIRSLTRRPLVTSVAVLSLGLGIGVNSAMFSLFDRLILRRLPLPSPDEIVLVTSPGPRPGSRSTDDFSGGELAHYLAINPWYCGEFAGPVGSIVRPADPGSFVSLPLGGHAEALRERVSRNCSVARFSHGLSSRKRCSIPR